MSERKTNKSGEREGQARDWTFLVGSKGEVKDEIESLVRDARSALSLRVASIPYSIYVASIYV